MSLDERISQRGRMVRNDMAKFAGEIDGKRKEIKALSGRHVGPGSEHGIRDETARLESEIGVLQLQHDENKKALVSLDQGMIPSGGSARWWAQGGYQSLFSDCHRNNLVDHANSLSGFEPPSWK